MNLTIVSIVIGALIIGGVLMFSGNDAKPATDAWSTSNVSMVDGVQIIEIGAKGGYSPQKTTAKAGLPTILRMQTQGSFDCSATVTIPSIGYRKNLPPSGTTDIEVPVQESGAILQGLCAMGMYNFQVQFN